MTHIDAQLLQELMDDHAAALALYARQWCRAPEDAVQEAFVELLRQNSGPAHPVAWLYTTVRRRAMNLARAENRRERHHRQAGQECEPWFMPPANGLPAHVAGNELDEHFDYQALLAQLPRLDREIVVARIWGELSFAEIADLVEKSVSSVHRRYQHALSELGRMMNQQLDHPRKSK